MFSSTVSFLKCPRHQSGGKKTCDGNLLLKAQKTQGEDVLLGELRCEKCHSPFPVLGGVAILVDSVQQYLFDHVKGISQVVSDSDIPKAYRAEYIELKKEIQSHSEHIEEDLEAQRVNSLYVMNHYLTTRQKDWKSNLCDPVIQSLIEKYWDHGPMVQIGEWMKNSQHLNAIELGCNVGGLYPKISASVRTYLGVDSSFASIALARHLCLGAPYSGSVEIPGDLINGPVSRKIEIPKTLPRSGQKVDFIVGDLGSLPVKQGIWDFSAALNTIDMLDDPSELPKLQFEILKNQGIAVQSCPYIWHEKVAKKLRKKLAPGQTSSSQAVKTIYQKAGFQIDRETEYLPWLFFKHFRQLEIYSVHAFTAVKNSPK